MVFKIVIPIIIFLFLLFFLLNSIFKRARRELFERLDSRFGIENLILYSTSANYFGRKSKGMMQVRGNGALALTEEGIFFQMAMPDEEFFINYSDILSADVRKSFLGKSVFKPLLHLEFKSNGETDEVAWYVENPEEWVEKILEKKDEKGV